ncbi:far1-related sequence 3 -like protein [Gossypium arboreum]|uniref:Far1-related sequence 3-like protein n=1 Tax=Gossypium arboreum TaxID=29729 RepID=A0A0B0N5C2_GOSAR|nr:far1-related sequence 3 -like protein [Gossypium arboreum]
MDVHVIGPEEGMSHRGMTDDGDAEPSEGELNHLNNSLAHDEDEISEPYLGMEFDSEGDAKTYYDEYCRHMGFNSKVGQLSRSKTDGTVVAREFVCGKDGLKRRSADSCDAMLRIELKGDKWVVTKFVKEHRHSVTSPSKVHYLRPRRHFAGAAKTMVDTCQGVGIVPSGVITFRVAKFEDVNKAYMVTLNYPEMRANCSCQMFEYSGILCRHVLTVFTVTNVLTLPSHYILKRWTRNAKSGVGTDERGGELHGQVSLTARYNSLCREAIKYAEDGAIATETYNIAMGALKEGGKKVFVVKKNVAKFAPPGSQASTAAYDDNSSSTLGPDTAPLLWPQQDEITRHFNLNDTGAPAQSVSDLNLPHMAPVSLHRDDSHPDNMPVLPCLKSMTWEMENKNSMPGNRVAVINLKLQDYGKNPSAEMEVKFQLSRVTLEPMLRSMAYISEQLSTPANRVAVINLKLQDSETTTGESEVKFQVSRDTLGAMLRSMAYIQEQLSNVNEAQAEPLPKKHRR